MNGGTKQEPLQSSVMKQEPDKQNKRNCVFCVDCMVWVSYAIANDTGLAVQLLQPRTHRYKALLRTTRHVSLNIHNIEKNEISIDKCIN
jgi:hypothetical protein